MGTLLQEMIGLADDESGATRTEHVIIIFLAILVSAPAVLSLFGYLDDIVTFIGDWMVPFMPIGPY